MKSTFLLSVATLAASISVPAADHVLHSFKKLHLDKYYWSEGANFGDLNRDGKPDAISGPYWWEGPRFEKRHELYPPTTTFTLKKADGTDEKLPGFEGVFGKKNAYSTDNFFTFVHDFNGDGWNDVLTFGLPGTPAYLYLNPQGKEQHWERHTVFDAVDNESPTFADLTGDGRPEIICNSDGTFGYAAPDWKNVTAKWPFVSISGKGPWGNFNHGLGLGDVNGDGRMDVLERGAWWEQPKAGSASATWTRHPAAFSPGGGAQMFAYDVNGDGLNDVITSVAAHGYGLGWYEQLRAKDADGHPQFKTHVFMNKEPSENRYGVAFSQLHAVELVDVDGDGLKDIVTGKCFWAHGPAGDPDPTAPAVLYWFQLVRGAGGKVDWVPHLIDDDSGVGRQIGVADVNGDGKPDLIIGNKKGTYVFLHETRKVSHEEWTKAQPTVKYSAAGDLQLKFDEVIQRTGPPRPNTPSPQAIPAK
ncbi:MAG: VCBS repeat-containing protein [Verrucomicrobia bacterium]|nr:VCBS repeat-containing protein [Verrucomicrobiota bacterium]